jgi:hypothetical protein
MFCLLAVNSCAGGQKARLSPVSDPKRCFSGATREFRPTTSAGFALAPIPRAGKVYLASGRLLYTSAHFTIQSRRSPAVRPGNEPLAEPIMSATAKGAFRAGPKDASPLMAAPKPAAIVQAQRVGYSCAPLVGS